MTWTKMASSGTATDPNSHSHSNKAVLDKIGETNGSITFNGTALGGVGFSIPAITELSAIGTSIGAKTVYGNTWVEKLPNYMPITKVNNFFNGQHQMTGSRGIWLDTTKRDLVPATTEVLLISNVGNDFGATIGTIGEKIDTTFIGCYHLYIEYMLAKNPLMKIFVSGALRSPGNKASAPPYNQAVKDIAAFYGIPYLNLWDFGLNDYTVAAYLSDDYHFKTDENVQKMVSRQMARLISQYY